MENTGWRSKRTNYDGPKSPLNVGASSRLALGIGPDRERGTVFPVYG